MASKNSDRSVKPQGDRFGEILVQLGMCDAKAIQEALSIQTESTENAKRIGEILTSQRIIKLRDVQKVLLQQQRSRGKKGRSTDAPIKKKRLGHFELLSKLGEGGMGTVYKARDVQLDRIVAVKVLRNKVAGDQKFLIRFNREIKATASLNHPNIVTAFGAGEIEKMPYLAMEFVEGQNLRSLLKKKKHLHHREALELIKKVAAGLEHAHQKGLIHRDIKPDNILLGKAGEVKLADLGLAKSIDDDQRLTKTGTAIGTPHYISPEQARGDKVIDHRSDIYSLGATFYVMLTGQRPFQGKNNAEVMLKHLQEELENPQDIIPEISDSAEAIVSKMMGKRPSDRYPNCKALIKDIDQALTSPDSKIDLPESAGATSIRPPKRKRKKRPARPRTSKGSGCMIFVIAGLGSLYYGAQFLSSLTLWS